MKPLILALLAASMLLTASPLVASVAGAASDHAHHATGPPSTLGVQRPSRPIQAPSQTKPRLTPRLRSMPVQPTVRQQQLPKPSLSRESSSTLFFVR